MALDAAGRLHAVTLRLDMGVPLSGAGQRRTDALRAAQARARIAADRRADRRAKRRADELAQQQAAAPAAPQPQAAEVTDGTVGVADVSAFESCVISAESGGDPTAVNPVSGAGGLFQFLPSTWAALGFAGAYPGGAQTAPSSVQETAFSKLYAEDGTSPWAPYDGC